ncbi:MAG TPA: hypothetical protein VK574_06090 [Terracidiphilus sp.]|nr:hypothetical protein [Terracidiphilus sp.]
MRKVFFSELVFDKDVGAEEIIPNAILRRLRVAPFAPTLEIAVMPLLPTGENPIPPMRAVWNRGSSRGGCR